MPMRCIRTLVVCGLLATVFATGAQAKTLRPIDELESKVATLIVAQHIANYSAIGTLLNEIADHKSKRANESLQRYLDQYSRRDVHLAAVILAAKVRNGSPNDLMAAIRFAEQSRNASLVGLLHKVFRAARRPETRHHLRSHVLRHATPYVKEEAIRALAQLGDKEAAKPLMQIVMSTATRPVRASAIEALGMLGSRRARVLLEAILLDEDTGLRMVAAHALGLLAHPRSSSALKRALKDRSPRVREQAALALGALRDESAVSKLITLMDEAREEDLRLADAYHRALKNISGANIGMDVELWKAWQTARAGRPKSDIKRDPKTPTEESTYHGIGLRSDRIVFVLDVSNSMAWNKRLVMAKAELLKVIDKLRKSTQFNLLTFSNRVNAWQPSLKKALPGSRARAKRFARVHKPGGGTNTIEALHTALADPNVDTIFFLSDGYPSMGPVIDPELILLDIARRNRFRKIRIHCIALVVGDPPVAFAGMENAQSASAFMKRLAEQNDGMFKLINTPPVK